MSWPSAGGHPMPSEQNARPSPLALRPKDAARALGIGERKLWELTKAGAIPHARIGCCVLYPVPQLEAWLAEQASASARGAPVGRRHAAETIKQPLNCGAVLHGRETTPQDATLRGEAQSPHAVVRDGKGGRS